MTNPPPYSRPRNAIASIIFASRWLQLPIYLGLIVVQLIYAYKFMKGLWHLLTEMDTLADSAIMLAVLNLIDVVMIANLLLMVIIGGYETFVSKLNTEDHPRPARMAEPRQCLGVESQTLDGDYQHLLHPYAANLHQRGATAGKSDDVATAAASRLPRLRAGNGADRPHPLQHLAPRALNIAVPPHCRC